VKKPKRPWAILAAYAAAVLIVSVIPIQAEAPISRLDKAAHVCEYLLFAWLLIRAIRTTLMRQPEYLWWAWVYATSYGLLIELIQGLLPWRSGNLADALANGVGAALGVWIGHLTTHGHR
jgi:VanZ family protein